MSHAQTATEQQNDRQVADPEVVAKAQRRQFSAAYKQRILEEADACTEPGQIGALLRREGLYSSHLSKWRRSRKDGQAQALSSKQRGRKGAEPAAETLTQLQRENEQLRAQLEQAELIVDIQKNSRNCLG